MPGKGKGIWRRKKKDGMEPGSSSHESFGKLR